MDCIKVTNYKQASAYIKYGLQPVKVIYTDKLVFLFEKEDTLKSGLWEKWKNRELEM